MDLKELQTVEGVLKWMRHGQYQRGHKDVARAIARAMTMAAAWDAAPTAVQGAEAMRKLDADKPLTAMHSLSMSIHKGPPPAAKKDT